MTDEFNKHSTGLMDKTSETTLLLPRVGRHKERNISVLRAQIVIVLVHMFMTSVSTTYYIVLTQYLVDRLARESGYNNLSSVDQCNANTSDPNTTDANIVQQKVAYLETNFTYIQTIPALIACFLVGSYSDYIGRRILLLLPIFSQFLLVSLVTLVIRFNLDLNLLYLGYAIDGMVGSWPVIYIMEFAITADINVSKNSRTSWMYAVLCIGSIVLSGVNLATSYLIQTLGFFYASLLLSGMGLLNFLIPLLFLQETLVHNPTTRVWNPMFHFHRLFGIYVSQDSRRRRATRLVCLIIFIFGVANEMNLSTIDSLYQLHSPFCWDSLTIGEYTSIRYGASNIGGAIWLAALRRCLPVEVIAMVGVAFQAAAFAFEAFVKHSWQFYIVPGLLVPNSCAVSISRAMLSLLVPSDQQGAMFSSVAVVETLCSLSTGIAYNQLYGATVSTMPGAIYLLMSSCAAVAFIFFIIYFIIREKPTEQDLTSRNDTKAGHEPLVLNT